MYRQAIAHNFGLYRRSFLTALGTSAAGLLLMLSLVIAPAASAISIGGPSDCDDNAVIRCGAHSTAALTDAYNSSAYMRAVYANFGISAADMANLPATDVAGRVTKSGDVFVDGQSRPVATGAMTGGRQDMPGSTRVNVNGAVFFKRPPSVSFQQASLPAFVSMKDGRFQFAVIASCGNAVSAVPTAPPRHQAAVAPARAVTRPPAPKPAPPPAPNVSVNNTNVNQNQNTQISQQSAAVPAPQPQAAAETPATQPATQTTAAVSTLPNTGPTGVVGGFLAAVGLGALGWRRLLLKRLSG